MNSTEYFKNVHRTESPDTHAVPIRILHGAIGICTEAGEVMDTVKKSMFYGRGLDKVNLKEELGDLLWYMGLMCSELGVSFEQLMDENIAKLKTRYPDKFTQEAEQGRDYGKEAEAVKQAKKPECFGKSCDDCGDSGETCEKCKEVCLKCRHLTLCAMLGGKPEQWADNVAESVDKPIASVCPLPTPIDPDYIPPAPESLTCFDCPQKPTCEYADDPYNTDGDCLANK